MIEKYLEEKVKLINSALEKYLPSPEDYPQAIHKAMHYSVMNGGKRLRPILTIAAAEAVGGKESDVMPFACALEIIHTYSLIHDDLPAMDDSDFRRGKPSSHKVFGEAFAVLAGDALLTYAFHLMTNIEIVKIKKLDAKAVISLIHDISQSIGTFGLIGGQVVDIQSENKTVEIPVMEYIHTHKTGALIRVSVKSGAILGGGKPEEIKTLVKFAEKIGLAFQIVDDILDEEGKKEIIGKSVGQDKNSNKSTYPSIWGLQVSKERARELVESAIALLHPFGKRAANLRDIALYVVERNR